MPLQWNPFTGNFQVPIDPSTIGQFGFTTTCSISEQVGDPVLVSLTSDETVEKTTNNTYNPRRVVGVVFSKASDTSCFVAEQGLMTVPGASFVRGLAVWVSSTGVLTTTVPTTGVAQFIGTAYSSTKLLLNVATRIQVQS